MLMLERKICQMKVERKKEYLKIIDMKKIIELINLVENFESVLKN